MITTGTDTDMDSIFSAGTAAPERVPRRREHGQVNNALKSLTRVLKKMCEEDAAPRPAKRTRTSHDLNDELTHLIRKKTELKKLRREMDSDDSDGETVGLQLSSLRDKIRVLKEKIFPTSVDSTCTPPAAAAAVANNNVTRTPPSHDAAAAAANNNVTRTPPSLDVAAAAANNNAPVTHTPAPSASEVYPVPMWIDNIPDTTSLCKMMDVIPLPEFFKRPKHIADEGFPTEGWYEMNLTKKKVGR